MKRARNGEAKSRVASSGGKAGDKDGAFDPKLLLNPKAALLRKRTSSPEKDINQTTSLERLYGVRDRKPEAEKPRVKDSTKPPGKEVQTRTTGIVGKELQEASKKAEEEARRQGRSLKHVRKQAETIAVSDDDEDDLILVGAATKSEQRVCFGMLKAHVNAFAVPHAQAILPTQWPAIPCELARGNGSIIFVSARGSRFGVLTSESAAAVSRLVDLKLVDISARVPTRPRKPDEQVGGESGKSMVLSLELVLYGDAMNLEKIGIILSQKNCFLVTPVNYDTSLAYTNPHVRHSFKPAAGANGLGSSQTGTSIFKTAEELSSEIQGLFDQLRDSLDLPEHETPEELKTQLLRHQRQALTFCLQHEQDTIEQQDHQVWRKAIHEGRTVWRNVITPQVLQKRPRMMRGGILADEMGLGKTLSIISLICASKASADAFVQHADAIRPRTKATLIVAPLSVLSNWAGQIDEHSKGSLSILIDHGKTRTFEAAELKQYDVILTTYALVANEFKRWKTASEKPYVLPEVDFYRIVLDEAHQIKDITTQQSQAAAQLGGLNRWAVTASPVHNSLNDLAALFAFLHLDPFDNRAVWAQYITGPMKSGQPIALNRLQTLLKMTCLRRTKDLRDSQGERLMELPPRTEELRMLQLDDREKKLYDDHLEQYQRRMRVQGDKISTLNVLQCINRLRQICIHTGILADMDGDPNTTDKPQDLGDLFAGQTCATCGDPVIDAAIDIPDASDDSDSETENGLPTFNESCMHCFCISHANALAKRLPKRCPVRDCLAPTPFAPTPIVPRPPQTQKPRRRQDSAKSTKLAALMRDLEYLRDHSPGVKWVVFSQFTSFLNLVSGALDERGMVHARLEGGMSREERSRALERLSGDGDGTLGILVSTRAGGVGLNLTRASRVFVMEPSWNPSVEAQAIDRVHRIGQTREVVATRYIIEGSIEQTMLALQKQKRDLASLSLSGSLSKQGNDLAKKLLSLKSLLK